MVTLTNKNPQRGMDFLRRLAVCYNRRANADKNEVALRTEEFINERVKKINEELGLTEDELADYKRRHSMTGLSMDATQAVQLSNQFSARLSEADAQIRLIDYLRDYVGDPRNKYQVISPTLGNASTGSQTVSSTRALQTYLVSNNGTISFPVLGTLKVGGLSKAECEKLIHDCIIRYLSGKEDPVVTVRMANYKISVLGEVARPGMFTVNNEKINIFEALAQAGDLTIYGVRDRVKLIRENADGKKRIYTMNLNDANIINSPCYYLQQNDIVYVEPNKVKARNSSVGQTTTLWLTSTSILVSVASFLFNILK